MKIDIFNHLFLRSLGRLKIAKDARSSLSRVLPSPKTLHAKSAGWTGDPHIEQIPCQRLAWGLPANSGMEPYLS